MKLVNMAKSGKIVETGQIAKLAKLANKKKL